MKKSDSQLSTLNSQFFKRGFTFAELIIVLSIIGILITAGAFAYNQSLKASRDKRRISDMQTIRTALELYYEENGKYPQLADGISALGQYIGCNHTNGSTKSIDELLAPYLNPVPKDPLHNCSDTNPTYYYAYDPSHWRSVDSGCYPSGHDLDYLNNGTCDCATDIGGDPAFGFNKTETYQAKAVAESLKKDTCAGENMNLDQAYYTVILTP